MEKYYLFQSQKPIQKEIFESSLEGIGIARDSIVYTSPNGGYFIAEASLSSPLSSLLLVLHDDLSSSLSFLCCHQNSPLMQKCTREALSYFPNTVAFPTDVLMKEMSFGDYSSYGALMGMFRDVPHELMLTAGTYLRCGLDASMAAKELYIHRNTFNYRLANFIEKTGLDIRDYHHAILLELYFHLSTSSFKE